MHTRGGSISSLRLYTQYYIDIITKLNELIARLLCIALIGLTAIILFEVGARYMLDSPSTWVYETSKMAFGFIAIWGGGYTLIVGDHINIDLFLSKFTQKKQAYLNLFNYLVFCLTVCILMYLAFGDALQSIKTEEHSNSSWGQPLYHWRMAVVGGLFMLFLQASAELIKNIWFLIFNENLK